MYVLIGGWMGAGVPAPLWWGADEAAGRAALAEWAAAQSLAVEAGADTDAFPAPAGATLLAAAYGPGDCAGYLYRLAAAPAAT